MTRRSPRPCRRRAPRCCAPSSSGAPSRRRFRSRSAIAHATHDGCVPAVRRRPSRCRSPGRPRSEMSAAVPVRCPAARTRSPARRPRPSAARIAIPRRVPRPVRNVRRRHHFPHRDAATAGSAPRPRPRGSREAPPAPARTASRLHRYPPQRRRRVPPPRTASASGSFASWRDTDRADSPRRAPRRRRHGPDPSPRSSDLLGRTGFQKRRDRVVE